MLIISGHFDGVTEFYSDRLDASEYLPVGELERVSCSDSCPGLFSQLKEVYLFGCNTLNSDGMISTATDAARSLGRSATAPGSSVRPMRTLDPRSAESSRERMRRIFRNVPVIYGFSSVAPLGPTAAGHLNRYFQATSGAEIGRGRPSARLLAQFATESLTTTSGITESDPHAAYRRDVCQFIDARRSAADKLAFIHELLGRNIAQVGMYFERIETLFSGLSEIERQSPEFIAALSSISTDRAARDRFLHSTEGSDQPVIRARMIRLAGALGWYSHDEQRTELADMVGELLARPNLGAPEVDLICTLNKDHALDGERERLQRALVPSAKVAQAAALACNSWGRNQRYCHNMAAWRASAALPVVATLGVREIPVRAERVYAATHPCPAPNACSTSSSACARTAFR
ncbi:MAG: hypothetical protein ABIR52_03620 [Casimicrobiaceae bacterium]